MTAGDPTPEPGHSERRPLPGAVAFRHIAAMDGFTHGLERDLHLVATWDPTPSSARQLEELVGSLLTIVGRYRLDWTPQHAARNLERIREVWPTLEAPVTGSLAGRSLHVLAVEDPTKQYAYIRDTKGRVRLANLAVQRLVAAVDAESWSKSKVSATDHPTDFMAAGSLLLGPEQLDELVIGEADPAVVVHREADLVGAVGWASLEELFRVLRWAVPYVLLRSRGSLLEASLDQVGDVDLLCAAPHAVAGVANATKLSADPYNAGHRCTVDGKPLRLDLHAVGDGYYDARWQSGMLERAELSGDGVVVPRVDDLFFSLLYHVKIHKSSVAVHHRDRLCELAPRMGLAIEPTDLEDDAEVAHVLGGFLVASGYPVAEPRDPAVATGMQRPFVERLRRMDLLPLGSVRFSRHQVALRSVAAMRGPRRLLAHPRLRPVAHRLRRVLVRLGL